MSPLSLLPSPPVPPPPLPPALWETLSAVASSLKSQSDGLTELDRSAFMGATAINLVLLLLLGWFLRRCWLRQSKRRNRARLEAVNHGATHRAKSYDPESWPELMVDVWPETRPETRTQQRETLESWPELAVDVWPEILDSLSRKEDAFISQYLPPSPIILRPVRPGEESISGNGLDRIEEEEEGNRLDRIEEKEEAASSDAPPDSLSVTRLSDASPSQGPEEAALEVLEAPASSLHRTSQDRITGYTEPSAMFRQSRLLSGGTMSGMLSTRARKTVLETTGAKMLDGAVLYTRHPDSIVRWLSSTDSPVAAATTAARQSRGQVPTASPEAEHNSTNAHSRLSTLPPVDKAALFWSRCRKAEITSPTGGGDLGGRDLLSRTLKDFLRAGDEMFEGANGTLDSPGRRCLQPSSSRDELLTSDDSLGHTWATVGQDLCELPSSPVRSQAVLNPDSQQILESLLEASSGGSSRKPLRTSLLESLWKEDASIISQNLRPVRPVSPVRPGEEDISGNGLGRIKEEEEAASRDRSPDSLSATRLCV